MAIANITSENPIHSDLILISNSSSFGKEIKEKTRRYTAKFVSRSRTRRNIKAFLLFICTWFELIFIKINKMVNISKKKEETYLGRPGTGGDLVRSYLLPESMVVGATSTQSQNPSTKQPQAWPSSGPRRLQPRLEVCNEESGQEREEHFSPRWW